MKTLRSGIAGWLHHTGRLASGLAARRECRRTYPTIGMSLALEAPDRLMSLDGGRQSAERFALRSAEQNLCSNLYHAICYVRFTSI